MTSREKKTMIRNIAVHEAGHATTALLLWPVHAIERVEISLDPETIEGSPGRTSILSLQQYWTRNDLFEEMMVSLGSEAARLLDGKRPHFLEFGCDYKRFNGFADLYLRDYAPGRPTEADLDDERDWLYKYLLFRTRTLLKANWKLVLAIADLLVDQGTLTTDDLARELGAARKEQAA